MRELLLVPIVLVFLPFGCRQAEDNGTPVGPENTEALCMDRTDNDADGSTDCDDSECVQFQVCQDAWHNKSHRGEVHDPGMYVSAEPSPGAFALAANGVAAPLAVADTDFDGVKLAVQSLAADIGAVTTVAPPLSSAPPADGPAVVIGTIGHNPYIDGLIGGGALDVSAIVGKWETFLITTVIDPARVDPVLVVAGSDQRGTIFGAYDLSAQIGVSPWHFWADVPPKTKPALYVMPGVHSQGEPAVKYRGIFINDENPALKRWHDAYFPEEGYVFKKGYYAKVYEAMLRIKANYLWPAVWGRAFAEDDPENHAEAKRYGIVIGTSHEAPMMRGIEEWVRGVTNDSSGEPISDPYGGNGEWSYRTNQDAVEAYWRDGIQRMVEEDFEGIITIGMRGPGDVALPATDGIPLVNEFIASQRQIIAEEFDGPPQDIPQVWTLYKEVLTWWEQGLRAPSDVTVIWPDDNWGNMRKLPDPQEPPRTGGYGLYYHFDYVGGPRSYKWVDTNFLPNIWEQLHLSYQRGVDRIWIVNVGDFKGNELPTQFFMDYAWNPERWPVERLPEWERSYAAQQFGEEHADAIADLLHRYTKLQSDRKPELLNERIGGSGPPFSITNYREMERITEEWSTLAADTQSVGATLPDTYQDTYYQLVSYAIEASALMYELRLAGYRNELYATQGRASTNDQAVIAETYFEQSRSMAEYYNEQLSGGKWNGFQTQPYLGYSSWQQPEENYDALEDFIYPELQTVELPAGAMMGVGIDGSDDYWPNAEEPLQLPTFGPYQTQPAQYLEVFNLGTEPFDYRIEIEPESEWLTVSEPEGTLDGDTNQVRAVFTVDDWSSVPEGTTSLTLRVTDTTNDVSAEIAAIVDNPTDVPAPGAFVEANGVVAMDAGSYSRIVDGALLGWKRIPELGRTSDAMTPFPVTATRVDPLTNGGRLEYDMHLFTSGELQVQVHISPRQNVLPSDDLLLALSIDDEPPQNVAVPTNVRPESNLWQIGVSDNVHRLRTTLQVPSPGPHTLKVWAVDPTIVLQKLVIDTGGLRDSNFGPPQSYLQE